MSIPVSGRLAVATTQVSLAAGIAQSFQRPDNATPYTIGDLIANSTVAGSVVAMKFPLEVFGYDLRGYSVHVHAARLSKSNTVGDLDANIHMFSGAPEVTNGDNGAFLPTDLNLWLGKINVKTEVRFANGRAGRDVPFAAGASPIVIPFPVDAEDISVYALLEAQAAYTPAANETFEVALEVG